MWTKIGIAIASNVLTAAMVDLTAYQQSLKSDPSAKFDVKLFGVRILIGVVSGALIGGGLNAATGAE